jgi:hypothetical protein
MEDAHHITMQPTRPDSIARSDTAIRQPDREIVAHAGFLIYCKPCRRQLPTAPPAKMKSTASATMPRPNLPKNSGKAESGQKQKRDRKRVQESSPSSDPYFLSGASAGGFEQWNPRKDEKQQYIGRSAREKRTRVGLG